jgi:hypothetical protein
MRRLHLVLVAVLAACAGPAADTTTTTPTTVAAETTTTVLEDCGAIPYDVGELPPLVEPNRPVPDEVPQDEYTTIPGTRSDLWFDGDGALALVFVRGALPPREWPGERGKVSIDGAEGVAGPFPDGSWVVAWFEGSGDRCNQYFLVFYPPVAPAEVEATVASLDRTAG